MIKYCLEKWDKNKGLLEEAIKERTDMAHVGYIDLVKMVVKYILNNGGEENVCYWEGWSENVHEIDDGDCQGTLLFLIPRDTYQPSEYEYLMANVYYGSCCGCDTLQGIQSYMDYSAKSKVNEEQLKDFMTLCKDLVTSIVCPYNKGWRHNENFDEVEFEE